MPLYAALADLDSGKRTEPVAIVQIGDSHTANDSFSGRMRELFQARFGDGGRGLLPPGIPFRYYRPAGASVAATGWAAIGSYQKAPGPFGAAGLRQHADGPADMTLALDAGADEASVEVLRQPGGGTIEIAADGEAPVVASTAGAGPAWLDLAPPHGLHTLSLHARGDGPVDLLAWRGRHRGPGVTWSNLGTPGATVGLVERWDDKLLAADLGRERPAMVVVAFGTNEAFRNRADLDDPADFGRAMARLRRAAPGAAMLVALPLDGVRHAGPGEVADCPGGYATPPGLAVVRARERAAAGRAYVWDWSAAMGTRCTMVDWIAAVPQLAAPDGVHLRQDGYRMTAEALFADLMVGYDAYRAQRR